MTETVLENLEAMDFNIPCTNIHWHTGDDPACWILTWRRHCPCKSPIALNCDPCLQKILNADNKTCKCSECGHIYPGPFRIHLLRVEPLKP